MLIHSWVHLGQGTKAQKFKGRTSESHETWNSAYEPSCPLLDEQQRSKLKLNEALKKLEWLKYAN